MDQEINQDRVKELDEGVILKSAEVDILEVTDSDLRKINKYTLAPLSKEEVFAFKVNIGDNETDDRNYEPFNLQALKDLKKLYVGRTVIKDHRRSADNQVARIYDTELVSESKLTNAGEPFASVIAKCYMVKTNSNADLIKEIKAGIKKEVSTSARAKKLICNICGTDNTKTYCPHYPGRKYAKDTGEEICMMTIDGVKEAYELSLVAVPAQPRAGTVKHYGPKPEDIPEKDLKEPEQAPETTEEKDKDLETNLRVKLLESFIFAQKSKEIEEEN